MRVWDIRRAVQALHSVPGMESTPIHLRADRDMGVNAAFAALFESSVAGLELTNLPRSQAAGPDYLNVLKFLDLPQLMQLLGNRVQLR
jgi:hypothetical protein